MEVKKKLLDKVIFQALRAQERKYPHAKFETKWQFLFPMKSISTERNALGVQELLGHKSVETTMIYTHVVSEMNKAKVVSPLDF